MNQDETRREEARPLEEAVERQDRALEQIKEAVPHAGSPANRELQEALEKAQRQADEVKRELGHQDTGTLPKSTEGPESPQQEPIGGLG